MPASYPSRPRIQLWCPELFAVGGIQAYSRQFLDALLQNPHVELIDVLSRNDEALPPSFAAPATTRFALCGRSGETASRRRFATALLAAGLRRRPDLIITTHLYFAPIARWLQRLARIPFWTIVHGVESWGPLRPNLATALRSADQVLAVSRFSRNRVTESHYVETRRARILPNTFEEARFMPMSRSPELLAHYGIPPDRVIVLTVARMAASERYKGIDEILAVFPDVLTRVPNAHYLVLGDGDDRARLEKIVRNRQLQANVTFGGIVPRDELCAHYNLCDLFAMPSRGEGFGIVFLEALACGRPVLAGNKDGSADPLRDGELGLLVDPDDSAALRDAIVDVLQKRHPHPNIFRPEFLRDQVLLHFGVASFRAQLDALLREFFLTRTH